MTRNTTQVTLTGHETNAALDRLTEHLRQLTGQMEYSHYDVYQDDDETTIASNPFTNAAVTVEYDGDGFTVTKTLVNTGTHYDGVGSAITETVVEDGSEDEVRAALTDQFTPNE